MNTNNITIIVQDDDYEPQEYVIKKYKLINHSEYFRVILEDKFIDVKNGYLTYKDVNPYIFGKVINWINGDHKLSNSLDKTFALFELLDRFSIKDFDIVQSVYRLYLLPGSVTILTRYLRPFFPDGWSKSIIDAIAYHYRIADGDLIELDKSLKDKILASIYCRRYDSETSDLVLYLEGLAKQEQETTLKTYIVTDKYHNVKQFVAYGIADLALLLRDHLRVTGGHLLKDPIIKIFNVYIEQKIRQLLKSVTFIDVQEEIVIDDMSPEYNFISNKGRGNISGVSNNKISINDNGILYNNEVIIGKVVKYDDPNYSYDWRLTQINNTLTIDWYGKESTRPQGGSCNVSGLEDDYFPLYDHFMGFVECMKKNAHGATIAELFSIAPHYNQLVAFICIDFYIHVC